MSVDGKHGRILVGAALAALLAAGCAGDNGSTTLVSTAAEPAGANCAGGGVKIQTGIDSNANGTLDPGEVIAAQTRYVCNGAGSATTLVVTSPDLTAMTDGYAVIKNVAHNNRTARVMVVVNRAQSAVEGLEVFGRIDRVSRKFLDRRLMYLGHVLNDPRVTSSVAARIPIVLNQPAAPASACLRGVGRALRLEIDQRRVGPECA